MNRAPLDAERLRAALAAPWTGLRVVEQTGSTNADLLRLAERTESGTVLAAEHQTAGRGRLDRGWLAPPRSGLTFSALLRPVAPRPTWGWLPLLAGVALRDAVSGTAGVDVALKWPNDLLAGPRRRKAAGILVQATGDAAVVGIGLNVTTTPDELGLATATSLAEEGATTTDRTALLVAALTALGRRYASWEAAGGDAAASGLAGEYRARCATLGHQVRVSGTDGGELRGTAVDVDEAGQLLVATPAGVRPVAAGDVEHLRPDSD